MTERPEARPEQASWLDGLIALVHRQPIPATEVYLVAMVPLVVLSNASAWLSGFAPVGTFAFKETFWGIWTVGVVWIVDHLERVAGEALEAFRPATSLSDEAIARARRELTTIPARPAAILGLAMIPLTLGYYLAAPEAEGIVGMAPVALVGRAATEIFSTAVMVLLLLQGVRWVRAVRRLHAAADRIDLFRPEALHAFSRLTSRTGLTLIGLIVFGLAAGPPIDPVSGTFVQLWLPWLIGFTLAGLAVFLYPLIGMHGRLVAEKARLVGATEERLKGVLAALDRDADAVDIARADGLGKLLAAVLQEREIVARLPTWPWSAGTLRGFVSALFLPLVLFLIQRALLLVLPA